jgi:hypothetical protein
MCYSQLLDSLSGQFITSNIAEKSVLLNIPKAQLESLSGQFITSNIAEKSVLLNIPKAQLERYR